MEDQDRETRIDEDVEGHVHQGTHVGANLAKDEGEDVEGHVHQGTHVGANLAKDEGDDDVEGHVHL